MIVQASLQRFSTCIQNDLFACLFACRKHSLIELRGASLRHAAGNGGDTAVRSQLCKFLYQTVLILLRGSCSRFQELRLGVMVLIPDVNAASCLPYAPDKILPDPFCFQLLLNELPGVSSQEACGDHILPGYAGSSGHIQSLSSRRELRAFHPVYTAHIKARDNISFVNGGICRYCQNHLMPPNLPGFSP